jgi:carbon starvation protein
MALCLATTVILKMQLAPPLGPDGIPVPLPRRPAIALVTFVPLVWLLAVTLTAGVQKVFHADPRIGFLSQAAELERKAPALAEAVDAARVAGEAAAIQAAEKAFRANRTLRFNNRLDAAVAGTFLVLVVAIVILSVREWVRLLHGSRPIDLRETPPVWLAPAEVAEGPRGPPLLHVAPIVLGLARELSGEAALARADKAAAQCACTEQVKQSAGERYVQVTNERFNGIRRCC